MYDDIKPTRNDGYNRKHNSGKGLTKEGWRKIKEFNAKAADPNHPEVKFTNTFENKEIARAASRKGAAARAAMVAENPRLEAERGRKQRLTKAFNQLAAGKPLSNQMMQRLVDTMNDVNRMDLDLLDTIERLEDMYEVIEEPEKKAWLLSQITKHKQDFRKTRFQHVEEAKKKLSVDAVSEMIKKAKQK